MLNSQKMNLNYIRTFVILGQSKNMSEVSKKIGINVSNVSRHIRQLEKELNTKLIISGTKNKELQLTETGKYFYDHYEKVYNQILLTEKRYKETLQLDSCKITIGIRSELEKMFLIPKITEYLKKYPNTNLKIINGDTEKLSKRLTQYAIDIAIDKNMPINNSKLKEVISCKIGKGNLCYVYSKKYFEVTENINEMPLIVPISYTEDRIEINSYFSDKNVFANIKYEVEDINQLLTYVKNGIGVGIIMKELIEDTNDLEIIDMGIEKDIVISYMKDKITPSTKEFLKLFKIEL